MLTRDGSTPSDPMSAQAVLGIWGGASRRKVQVRDDNGKAPKGSGPWVQVSRLGNPLFNEVIVPIGDKDRWNAVDPATTTASSRSTSTSPSSRGSCRSSTPACSRTWRGTRRTGRTSTRSCSRASRPESSRVPELHGAEAGGHAAAERRDPADAGSKPNALGLVGGDPAGFPNGRRVFDDIVSIELKAVAGATIPLVDPSYTPDGAAALLSSAPQPGAGRYQDTFPYLGTPHDGYDTPSS